MYFSFETLSFRLSYFKIYTHYYHSDQYNKLFLSTANQKKTWVWK